MQPQPQVNILLVDDRAENLLALEAVLESLGQNLVRASSGEEALRCLLDQDFAVILLDVQMPDLDGFETAALIRARPRNQGIPIIFVTAFSKSDGLVFRGYDAGAVDYLFKPVVPEILRSKVAIFVELFNKTAEVKQQAEQLANANRILQQDHDQLEIRVQERTAELASANEELKLTIEQQHRTEAALRESEERFRLMANCAPVLIWMADIHTDRTFFNQGWLAYTGRTLEQEISEGWTRGVHPDDLSRCLSIYRSAFGARLNFEMEYRLRRADGTYGWIFDRATPLFLPSGDFMGYIGSCIEITDRKRAEEALRQSEERYRAFIKQSSEAIWRFELEQPIAVNSSVEAQIEQIYQYSYLAECNQAMAQMYGYTSAQALIGSRLNDLVLATDQRNIEYLRAFIGSGYRLVDAESYELDRDGQQKCFLNNLIGVVENGKLVRAWGNQRDITDRKRAEQELYQAKLELEQRVTERTRELSESNEALRNEILERQQTEIALRQSETRYRAIVEDQTELICRFQPDGSITFVNEAYCRYFGLEREGLIGNRYEPVVFPEDREQVAALVGSMSRENPMVMIENRVVIGREVYWTQWINRSLFNEQGEFIEFQAVGRDVTARKQVEAALEESQHSLQKIAETAPVILYVYDLIEGRNVYINREITELLGYTPEELQSMEPALMQSMLHPDDLALMPERYRRWETANEGDIIQTEYRMRHKDGEWRFFQSQETLFARTRSGLPKQILCAAVDITAAKQLEEVRRAEEQLQASLAEKEVLLKEIHHRVKNNLQIVDSLLRLHSRQVKDEQVAEILLESQNRIKSIALIHEKLYQSDDLAKIQFSDYIPNLVIHLFSSYKIDSSAVTLKIQVDDIALEIDTAIPCGLIINELVSNALKYAFPTDRAGEIRVEFRADRQRLITLAVEDNGIGMPEQFDPIQTKSLGLKLVWGLVEQLEGTIALDRNQGTRFTITFPGDQT